MRVRRGVFNKVIHKNWGWLRFGLQIKGLGVEVEVKRRPFSLAPLGERAGERPMQRQPLPTCAPEPGCARRAIFPSSFPRRRESSSASSTRRLEQAPLDSRLRALLSGINFHVHKAEHLFPVIPREVAESMQRLRRMRRLDSATPLRCARNDPVNKNQVVCSRPLLFAQTPQRFPVNACYLFRTAVRLRGNDDDRCKSLYVTHALFRFLGRGCATRALFASPPALSPNPSPASGRGEPSPNPGEP
jgi:hypothetical protein